MHYTNIKYMSQLYLTSSLLALLTFPAQAQTDNTDNNEDNIIVTATLREQALQEVPIAVTAVTDVQLERAGIYDLRTLSDVSASFNLSNSQTESGGTTFRLRGVGTTGNNIGLESSVGVFLDGIYLARPAIALADMLDLEQVEILRGPQGTLFGRNTSAGALNITTKTPSLSEFEGFANFTYGNYNLFNIQGGVSIPIINDALGIRLSGSYRSRDGYTNSTTGATSHDRDRYYLRGQALWTPTEKTDIRIIVDYADSNAQCCDAVVLTETSFLPFYEIAGVSVPNGGVSDFGPQALENITSNASQFTNPTDQFGVSWQLNHSFNNINLTYIGSYRDFNGFSRQDSDFTSAQVFLAEVDTNIRNHTQEIRLQGNSFNDRLDWLIGAYYSDEDITENQVFRSGIDFRPYIDAIGYGATAGGIAAAAGIPLASALETPTFQGLVAAGGPFNVFSGGADFNNNFGDNDFTQSGESFSIFTHNVFSITDQLSATIGLRYVDESKDGAFVQPAANSPGCFGIIQNVGAGNIPASQLPLAIGLGCFPFLVQADNPLSNINTFASQFEDEELLYTGNLAYKFSPHLSSYASFSHGFKSGGFNLDPTAASTNRATGIQDDPRFNSEEIDAYEIGLKANWDDIKVNIAVFHQDLNNFQVLEFTGTQFLTFNVAQALSTGMEIEIEGKITDNLAFIASGTYTDARYPEDCDNGDTSLPNASNLCGNDLTNASDFNGILGLNYEGRIGYDMGYFLNASLRYESNRRTSTQAIVPDGAGGIMPNPFDVQPANVKVNLRAGVHYKENWTFEVWGTNIFDQRTRSITFNLPLRGLSSLANNARGTFVQEPRFYGATLRYNF